MRSVSQRAAKLPSVNFENDSNPGGLEPGPNVLVHTLAEMAEATDCFLRPPTLTADNFTPP